VKLRYRVCEDGFKHYGDLSAVDPPYRRSMECDACRTRWMGCWDNFQCPECGKGELPNATYGDLGATPLCSEEAFGAFIQLDMSSVM
jgi:hypothetical protein